MVPIGLGIRHGAAVPYTSYMKITADEARRIADHADTYDLLVAPHCIASPLGTVASVHLCAAIPNFAVLEFHGQDVPFWDDILTGGEPLIRGGRVRVPDGPGLGVELNEALAREYRKRGEGFFEE